MPSHRENGQVKPIGGIAVSHVLNVGGNWNNSDNAGISYCNANNNWNNTNTNIGSRLA